MANRGKIIMTTLVLTIIFFTLMFPLDAMRWSTDTPHNFGFPFVYLKKGAYTIGGSVGDFYPGMLVLDIGIAAAVAFLIAYFRYRE
ncbi:MAG: hypothetical protein V1838_01210 [Patescibacteria group bacterium]